MARSHQTSNKKENEKKRQQKRKEKDEKKEERKTHGKRSFEEMLAYVDEFGNISSTPPDPTKKKIVIKSEDIQLGVPKHEESEKEDPIRNGTVTFFNDAKGYGFIQDLKSQERVFVHINGLVDRVQENDKVTFEVERGKKGLSAINVTKTVK